MKEEFKGHIQIADNNYGLRTLGETLRQESIAWKIHDKAWLTNVSSDTLMGAQHNHEYHKQLDMRLNDCLMVVLSKETAYATGQLAINVLRLECRKLTQQMSKHGIGRNDDGSCRDCGGA